MITTKTDYIGYDPTAITTYLTKTAAGKAARRFFLLWGAAGCGDNLEIMRESRCFLIDLLRLLGLRVAMGLYRGREPKMNWNFR